MKLNDLPMNVQNKVRNTLKAYDEVTVDFENGDYHVMTGCLLKASYAPDFRSVGTFKAKEVFTEDERTINYVESFHDFPIWYKGKRDYRMLKEVGYDWDAKFALVDGSIVRA